ncbi:hypothetical protein CPB83DRAFT_850726 [Crepidotus variabilis]|uniref:DUF6533 domain-containing protein n=1 Tax=Crepidotus variabilis TaxID=179855 RepID=A0A9P6EK39_9AGAR|nr:hypothetical protein CPB83DRAFT_850726 [Crepidotus variabilis]
MPAMSLPCADVCSSILGPNMTVQKAMELLVFIKLEINQTRYVIAAALGLQVYEWFAGLEDELRLVHRKGWTLIKILYLLCRYYPLLLWIVIIWAYVADHPKEICDKVVYPVNAILAPCQFFSQAVMLMRAFAFSGRNPYVLMVLGSCYLLLVGMGIWTFCTQVAVLPPQLFWALNGTGCFPNYGDGWMALRLGYTMLAAILMDLLSLIVVAFYCVTNKSRHVSLARYFFSQGLISFILVVLVNCAAAIAYFRPMLHTSGVGIPIAFVISNIVACRVILQLRARVYPTMKQIEQQHSLLIHNALDSRLNDDSWVMDLDAEVL